MASNKIVWIIILLIFLGSLFFFNGKDKVTYNFESDEEQLIKSSQINEDLIEHEIFELINYERQNIGLVKLKRNTILDRMSREYSIDMAERDFFSHYTPEGKDIENRLKEKEIFYLMATEDISQIPVYSDTNIAEEVVQGWINSPGHRVPILDSDNPPSWESVGIGVKCTDKYEEDFLIPFCYVTAEFVNLETEFEDSLSKSYLIYYPIYEEDMGMNYNTNVEISFESDELVRIIIAPNKDQFDRIIDREDYEWIERLQYIKSYNEKILAKPGYIFIVDADNSPGTVNYNLKFRYY